MHSVVIEADGYKLDVDIEKTIDYYKTNTLCMCPECRNFYIQAKESFPLLTQFLSQFGVDITRPDELSANEFDGNIDYHFVAFTVAGEILQSSKYEIDITDNGHFLNIVIDNTYVPNEQQSNKCFTVTVFNIQLPWVLKEPYPNKIKRTSLLNKVKTLFTKG